MSIYMLKAMTNYKRCELCCHFTEYENGCIKDIPTDIKLTELYNTCNKWEERREPIWLRRRK